MHFHLVVTSPFGPHAAGDLITEPDLVDQLLGTHHDRVVKVMPHKPAPARPIPAVTEPAITKKEG